MTRQPGTFGNLAPIYPQPRPTYEQLQQEAHMLRLEIAKLRRDAEHSSWLRNPDRMGK